MEQYRNKKNKGFKILPVGVVVYMLAAFSWWAVLLYRSNNENISLKKELYEIKRLDASDYHKSIMKYAVREKMILGEGLFFAISIIAGIGLIYRGYLLEARAGRLHKNFLLSVTHELKSPLSAIRLILETFKNRPQLDRDKSQVLVQDALAESARLQFLIEDLLFSSQLEESWKPDLQKLDIYQKTESLVANYTKNHPDWEIKFHSNSNHPVYIFADEQAFFSILRNLIDNAIKYATISKKIVIELLDENSFVTLKVADLGIGIPEAERKNIFKKFYRVGEEETRSSKGTGLGLYIVSQIVNAHHGYIKVQGNVPKGAVFVVRLPKGS